MPRELLGGQTEDYVEYSRTGQVIKGLERAKARSKYDEDGAFRSLALSFSLLANRPPCAVFPGNHSSVWGSFYSPTTGNWGFACCHSTIKNSYWCVPPPLSPSATNALRSAGTASIEAAQAEAQGGLGLLTARAGEAEREKSMLQLRAEEDARTGKGKRKAVDEEEGGRKRAVGEGDVDKRLDRDKLDEVLKGKSETFGGKPVTEEEMGMTLFASLLSARV